MASSSAKVCHVCHSGYRGLYMLHVSTKSHQRKANPTPARTWTKGRERGQAIGRARRYAERRSSGEGMVKVDKYRRRPPLDGPRKTVRVRDYWRDRAARRSSYPAYVPEPRYVTPYRRG
jgi:hypothetical protein